MWKERKKEKKENKEKKSKKRKMEIKEDLFSFMNKRINQSKEEKVEKRKSLSEMKKMELKELIKEFEKAEKPLKGRLEILRCSLETQNVLNDISAENSVLAKISKLENKLEILSRDYKIDEARRRLKLKEERDSLSKF